MYIYTCEKHTKKCIYIYIVLVTFVSILKNMYTYIHACMHTYIRYITLHYVTLRYVTLHDTT